MLQGIAAIIAIFSLIVATKALLLNLERSRRELAVRLIYDWANHLDWETSRAIRMAAELPSYVITAIQCRESVLVPVKYYETMTSLLRTEFTNDVFSKPPEDGSFRITIEHSAFIRHLWVKWLNRLEGTLAAWHRGAADISLMRVEFEPLIVGSEAVLKKLQSLWDGMPVTREFCRLYDEHKSIQVSEPLGLFSWISREAFTPATQSR
ncbi:hypothetical protein EDF57_103203 [Novosphingobium sp. PhB55]|nr:hypothetical protein EDF57_103203 [Novosphingobium sp. PhB55]